MGLLGSQQCKRCKKVVYAAEEAKSSKGIYHKGCFTCIQCSRYVDSRTLCEKDDIYCKHCYTKKYSPKGYGFGNALSLDSLSEDSAKIAHSHESIDNQYNNEENEKNNVASNLQTRIRSAPALKSHEQGCPRCGRIVYHAERIIFGKNDWHESCFTCLTCRQRLDAQKTCDKDGEPYCKLCYMKHFGPKGYGFGGGPAFLMTERGFPNNS